MCRKASILQTHRGMCEVSARNLAAQVPAGRIRMVSENALAEESRIRMVGGAKTLRAASTESMRQGRSSTATWPVCTNKHLECFTGGHRSVPNLQFCEFGENVMYCIHSHSLGRMRFGEYCRSNFLGIARTHGGKLQGYFCSFFLANHNFEWWCNLYFVTSFILLLEDIEAVQRGIALLRRRQLSTGDWPQENVAGVLEA